MQKTFLLKTGGFIQKSLYFAVKSHNFFLFRKFWYKKLLIFHRNTQIYQLVITRG